MAIYDPKSLKADEFINDGEILDTLRYADEHKNDMALIDSIISLEEDTQDMIDSINRATANGWANFYPSRRPKRQKQPRMHLQKMQKKHRQMNPLRIKLLMKILSLQQRRQRLRHLKKQHLRKRLNRKKKLLRRTLRTPMYMKTRKSG